MKISRWVVVLFLAAAIILFIGMFFWPFILNNIIKPTALVVWFLLRILILSVDQEYFWTIMILVAVIFLFRLLPRKQSSPPQQVDFPETNATINRIGYWHILFTYDGRNIKEDQILRQSLIHLLTSFYASKQRIANNFGIHEALRQGDLPLPENIHTYLFPQELQETGGRIKNFFQSFRTTPRKWIFQWSGQAKAEHERMISEVLNFMETSLEIKNDD